MAEETAKQAASRPSTTRPAREPRSYAGWIATLFVLALVGWMGSGYLYPEADPVEETPRSKTQAPFTVEAFDSKAKSVTKFVASEGQVSPDRMTPVRAKVGGTVEAVYAHKGQFLEEGTPIAKIALDDRAAQQAQAEAELARRQGEFDRVSNLSGRGYATAAEVEEAESMLATAKAQLAAVLQAAGDTEIRAPITGVLDGFDLDLGEFVAPSAEVGMQVDNDPLTVDIEVAQQNVGRIQRGQPAAVTFITGETRRGEVTYIAANANAATRTFPVEIRVPNPKRDIPAGISAQVRIPTGEIPAHFVSAALLALGPDGELGVKSVNAGDDVEFYPIELVRAETDGIWVSGLPQELRIISVGQGFVSAGEKVRVIAASADDDQKTPASAETGPLASGNEGSGTASEVAALSGKDAEDAEAARSPPASASGAASADASAELLRRTALESLKDDGDSASQLTWPVELLQQRLNELGYAVGPVDGIMGESTRSAIRAFQSDRGLDADGEISAPLAAALVMARPSEEGPPARSGPNGEAR